jgi:hypothetical protein
VSESRNPEIRVAVPEAPLPRTWAFALTFNGYQSYGGFGLTVVPEPRPFDARITDFLEEVHDGLMVEPRSRLGRLYTYSKDVALNAQENFTTEALRMAVEDDPGPMIEALCRLDPLRAERLVLRNAAGIRASTQVALLGGGWLDLVLEVLHGGRVTAEVWVEVKIEAPESGSGQLKYYQYHADRQSPPAWLLTLAPEALPGTTVPNLSWNVLYQCARHGQYDHRSWMEHATWKDLGTFLEEQNVANDALGEISDREAGSLEPAYELIQKVSALVVAVHKEIPPLFPGVSKFQYKNEGPLNNAIASNFRWYGNMVAASGPIRYGLIAEDGTAYWEVAVDAKNYTRETMQAARSRADGAALQLGADWKRPVSGSSILFSRARATRLVTHEAALAWFEGRLHELSTTAVVETLLRGDSTLPGDEDPSINPSGAPIS